jgi:hypothetical protein
MQQATAREGQRERVTQAESVAGGKRIPGVKSLRRWYA